jgi:hypothetical protein
LKLILNFLLFLVVFAFARRALKRLITPTPPPRTSERPPDTHPDSQSDSGSRAAFDRNEVIEDAEFEELD